MTTADERRSPSTAYPWHDAVQSVTDTAGSRSTIRGTRAGPVTRSLAHVADLVVVALVVAVGYAAIAATRFLLGPITFRFPAPSPTTLLLLGLCVQASYFAITWAVIGGTYGDRLLGLRVSNDRGGRLGPVRSTARAVLCTIFPIGLLWVLVSKENRSVQDVLLRSSVAYY